MREFVYMAHDRLSLLTSCSVPFEITQQDVRVLKRGQLGIVFSFLLLLKELTNYQHPVRHEEIVISSAYRVSRPSQYSVF